MDSKAPKVKLPKSLLDQVNQQSKFDRNFKLTPHVTARKRTRYSNKKSKKNPQQGLSSIKRLKTNDHLNEDKFCRLHDKVPSLVSKVSTELSSTFSTTSKSDNEERNNSSPKGYSNILNSKIDKLAKDDREIAALEKKLGFKKRKKRLQLSEDDGLNEIFEDLESREEKKGEKIDSCDEGYIWLRQKRLKAQKAHLNGQIKFIENKNKFASGANQEAQSKEIFENLVEDEKDIINRNSLGEFIPEHTQDVFQSNRSRENPYIPPEDTPTTEMFKPPSLRKPEAFANQNLVRLRRRIQGLINRFTESNLLSILGEIENIYGLHPRQYVTSILTEVLLASICKPRDLSDTLIILHAGLISAIYKVIGIDFGAEFVRTIVLAWNDYYARATKHISNDSVIEISKESSNIIMLLAKMYIFQVVGCNLIFDFIRLNMGELSELNTELLLKILRSCGPQLRHDDPSSLEDIMITLRKARISVSEQKMSMRTKFMIETINDLRNNRLKTVCANSAITSEHIIRMKKMVGSLNSRTVKTTEPLRVGLNDIYYSDKKGKWWLTSAGFSGHTKESIQNASSFGSDQIPLPYQDTEISDLIQLAREQRMNTNVRRAIFLAIMSASDYQDAFVRLNKLRLKRHQEFEIPKVLIRCLSAENNYNPYYTLIAKKFCCDRKLKKSFQYCLWDLFKRINCSDEEELNVEDQEKLSARNLVNIAKMYGSLIAEASLSLDVLKILNLAYLSPMTKTFVEILFITILLQSSRESASKPDEKVVLSVFSKIKGCPAMIIGFQKFLKEVVSKTDIAGGEQEKATVSWACKIAKKYLRSIAKST